MHVYKLLAKLKVDVITDCGIVIRKLLNSRKYGVTECYGSVWHFPAHQSCQGVFV